MALDRKTSNATTTTTYKVSHQPHHQQQKGLLHSSDRLVPQQTKNRWIHHDQVVPLPTAEHQQQKQQWKMAQRVIVAAQDEVAEDLTIPHGKRDDLPHTIIGKLELGTMMRMYPY